jgi:hypothetical protein
MKKIVVKAFSKTGKAVALTNVWESIPRTNVMPMFIDIDVKTAICDRIFLEIFEEEMPKKKERNRQ